MSAISAALKGGATPESMTARPEPEKAQRLYFPLLVLAFLTAQGLALEALLQGAAPLKHDGSTTQSGRDRARDQTKDPKLDPVAIEQNLRKALEASPESFEANYNLGEFYIQAGKLAEAIPNLEKACRLDSSHYVSTYDLSLAYLETGNYSAARKHLRAMLERQDAAELHDLLAEVEEKSGNYVEAANEYERAAHLEPTEQHIFDWGVELLRHQTLDPPLRSSRVASSAIPGRPGC
jgi:tetratricopeptide (TPR) repeat protein